MRWGWIHLRRMALLVVAALGMGLGANFLSRDPLPLFRPLAAPAAQAAVASFSEVDAEFVRQTTAAAGILLLDARSAAAYGLGRIPGALSLPLGDFAAAFPALEPRLRQAGMLVVYCSGRTCNDSRDLAGRLWSLGLKNLLLYKGGMEDWEAKGHAVER